MSNTPRTDAFGQQPLEDIAEALLGWAEFCAELETELAAANERAEDAIAQSFEWAQKVERVEAKLAASEAARLAAVEPCLWTDQEDYWQSDCGQAFVFNDGTPAENGAKFCNHCGKPIAYSALPVEEAKK